MKKRHITRHDAMMRMPVKDFTKGAKGSHYLIADAGTVDTLKNIGVHSKQIPVRQIFTFNKRHKTVNLAATTLLAR